VYKASLPAASRRTGRDIVVVTNAAAEDDNLRNMIADFQNACTYPVRVINIREFPFAGGCITCLH